MPPSLFVARPPAARLPTWVGVRLALCAALGLPLISGCATPGTQAAARLPSRHQVRLDRLVVKSDFSISDDDPRIRELHDLRDEVRSTLLLPPQRRPVVVYLFQDEDRYSQYMQAAFPNLPQRRAFFIGTPGELSVYAFWGEQVREDLRHEYTHGLLHASLEHVPLWLDEGLAEYFEVATQDAARINIDHAEGLATMVANGWQPDLKRMEQLEDVSEMQRADYQEAWAWAHFLLSESDSGRELLLAYMEELQSPAPPPSLADRIKAEFPSPEERLTAYISTFGAGVGRARVMLGQDPDAEEPLIQPAGASQ
ncbi:MAG: hypothetical protein DWQ34_02465 [Planctomycetota bacterium]|nr:MAG: hypothetical protein DWQ34_02465 [Planctomycetota bacterium]REK21207.1 MAG: hypothetical protein DWQ41_22625 [Planctomycetota bacterium]REK29615.1 MAG: hypothetical protein DWQ45_22660 [Planctomycetota bacterium]